MIARARGDFAKGEYRWVASAMNQVVFAHGHLYAGINTIVNPGPRDGIAWFLVDESLPPEVTRAALVDLARREAFRQ